MNRRTVAFVLTSLAIALLGYWATTGANLYTLQQVPVKTVDPLFGTESVSWKDEFHPGFFDMIGPAVGVLVAIAAYLLWSAARRRRSAASSAAASAETSGAGPSGTHTI